MPLRTAAALAAGHTVHVRCIRSIQKRIRRERPAANDEETGAISRSVSRIGNRDGERTAPSGCDQLIFSSSTSKMRTAFGPMGPVPCSP